MKLHESETLNRTDDSNPQFLFSTTDRALLIAITTGEIDARELAAKELGNRGYKNNMVWVGFDKAMSFWKNLVFNSK